MKFSSIFFCGYFSVVSINRTKTGSTVIVPVGSEVACPLRNSEVSGSTAAGVDRFSGCENRRNAYHMIMWHVKDPSSINFALVLSEKIKPGQYLASDESLD
ncbi:hypothetical protein TNCV_2876431 [Trichonephila clavipes]|nr:hypothetical protein TNCV_2876431 [Trichonephila clavipes]